MLRPKPPPRTIGCGWLKQPDKHELAYECPDQEATAPPVIGGN